MTSIAHRELPSSVIKGYDDVSAGRPWKGGENVLIHVPCIGFIFKLLNILLLLYILLTSSRNIALNL